MISKKHRFHGHNSLNYAYRQGKIVRTELLSLRFVPSRNNDYKLAVVVSKKVQKSAVIRNRIRRRIYEAFRLIDKEESLPPRDIIVTVFDERVAIIPTAQLRQNIESLLSKIDHKN